MRAGFSAAAVLLVLAACAHRVPQGGAEFRRPAWPPPPASPRVEWVGSVRLPSDLGIKKSPLVRFFSYLAGTRKATALLRPYGVAETPEGDVVVADPDARCVHVYRQRRSRYVRLTQAGREPLVSPVGVAVDPQGRIYVADSYRRTIERYGREGDWLDTLAKEGDLARPTGLAFDPRRDRLYVVDTGRHRIVAYDASGGRVLEIGRRGKGDGEFNFPVAVAVGPSGNLYVTDSMNFRVQILDGEGRFLGSFGKEGRTPGDFDKAKGIALDPDGHIYVVEGLHDVIHVYDERGRLLAVLGGTGTDPGQFWLPTAISISGSGRILISDSANHRVQILQYLGNPEKGAGG